MIYLRRQALTVKGPIGYITVYENLTSVAVSSNVHPIDIGIPSGPILSPLPAWEQGWPDTFRAYLTEKCVRLNTSKSSVYFLTTEK